MTDRMTWKDFKDEVEKQGVKDEDWLWMVDLTGIGFFSNKIDVFRDKDNNSITVFAG